MPKPDTQTLDAPIDVPDSVLGGSTAPAAPAAPAPKVDPDGPGDIMDFTFDPFGPPDQAEERLPIPATQPRAEPKPDPKPEVKGDAPADPDQKPAGEGDDPPLNTPPSDLREQVIAANNRAREAQKRLDDQRDELERTRNERNKLDERLKTTTDAISRVEATAHPQVTAITLPFEEKLANYCKRLDGTGTLGKKLRQLAPQLISQRAAVGDYDDEGFEKRNKEFTDMMEGHFGSRWEATADIITEGAGVMGEMNAKIAEITSDAERFRYEAQVSNHMKAVKQYEELEKSFGSVPPELRESNPDDSRVLLSLLMDEIPQLKEREPLLKQHLRRVNLPLSPIDPKSMEGMSDDEQILHMQERLQRYEQDRLQHAQSSYEGYMWRMAGPMLAKLVRNMRDRSTAVARSTPAPRENSASQTDSPEEQPLGPADFKIDPNPAGL